MNDYQWYLYPCGQSGLQPLSARRFEVMLAAYRRDFNNFATVDLFAVPPARRLRLIRRWTRLCELARLADAGRGVITAGTVSTRLYHRPPENDRWIGNAGEQRPNQEPPDTAPGVREPRRPIDPILAGAGSRRMPAPEDQPRYYAT